jgi:hypothetical protein
MGLWTEAVLETGPGTDLDTDFETDFDKTDIETDFETDFETEAESALTPGSDIVALSSWNLVDLVELLFSLVALASRLR